MFHFPSFGSHLPLRGPEVPNPGSAILGPGDKAVAPMRILNAVDAVRVRFELADLLGDGLRHAINADHAVRVSRRQENTWHVGEMGRSVRAEKERDANLYLALYTYNLVE